MPAVVNLDARKIRANEFVLVFDQLSTYTVYKVYINGSFYREYSVPLTALKFIESLTPKISVRVTGMQDNTFFDVQVSAVHDGIEEPLSAVMQTRTGFFFPTPDDPADPLTDSKLQFAEDVEFVSLNEETLRRLNRLLRASPLEVDVSGVTNVTIGDVHIEDPILTTQDLRILCENQVYLAMACGVPVMVKHQTSGTYQMLQQRDVSDPILATDKGLLVLDGVTHNLLNQIITILGAGGSFSNDLFGSLTGITPTTTTTIITFTPAVGYKLRGFMASGTSDAFFFFKLGAQLNTRSASSYRIQIHWSHFLYHEMWQLAQQLTLNSRTLARRLPIMKPQFSVMGVN